MYARHHGPPRAAPGFLGVCAILLLCLPASVDAQTSSTRAFEIVPAKRPEIKNGALAAVRGSVDSAGQRFVLRNLTMSKPVAVLLMPAMVSRDLNIAFAKATLEKPDLEGSTTGAGHYVARFRTSQDVTLLVRSAGQSEAPFLLLVWVGDDLKSKAPTQVLSPQAYRERNGGFGDGGLGIVAWVGIVAVALVIVGAALWFLRHRRST